MQLPRILPRIRSTRCNRFEALKAISLTFLSVASQTLGFSEDVSYTSGYEPHFRPEAPGSLIYRSPTPEEGGRLTNILYHQGWLMYGFENPGSDWRVNDLRFRVTDISNLESDPRPVPFWPSDFGLELGTDYTLDRRELESWYSGNWGYHTHGHGRTEHSVHWEPRTRALPDRQLHYKSNR